MTPLWRRPRPPWRRGRSARTQPATAALTRSTITVTGVGVRVLAGGGLSHGFYARLGLAVGAERETAGDVRLYVVLDPVGELRLLGRVAQRNQTRVVVLSGSRIAAPRRADRSRESIHCLGLGVLLPRIRVGRRHQRKLHCFLPVAALERKPRRHCRIGVALFCLFLALFASPFKWKSRLEAENAALRHQLINLRRKVRGRVRLTNGDRLFFIKLYRWFPSVLKAITIVRPETLVRWHRAGFRLYWHWKSRSLGGRPKIAADLRALIRQIIPESDFRYRQVSRAIEVAGRIFGRPVLGGLHHQYVRI